MQVTYGAILKLDEKFEMLQAKVASIQNPAVLSQVKVTHFTHTLPDQKKKKRKLFGFK